MNNYPAEVCFPVHWGEMDALGHVNNVRYFTWFETARIAYFTRIGLLELSPLGPILKSTECEFRRPLQYPAEIISRARVSRIGNSSFTMEYEISETRDPTEPCAVGAGVIVLIDYTTGRPTPLPPVLRASIEALEGNS